MSDSAHDALDDRLWSENWHFIAHRSELATQGRFACFEILGRQVAVYNDGAQIVAFDNRCPHRGTRIFDPGIGSSRFVCPYHGWSLIKGKFFIPDVGSISSEPASTEVDVRRYHSQWIGDLLFVSQEPKRDIAEQLGDILSTLSRVSESIDRCSDLNSYTYNCKWPIAVENALDQYHVKLIHANSLNRLDLIDPHDHFVVDNNIALSGIGDRRLKARLEKMRSWFSTTHNPDCYMSIYLFPFTFITTTFGYSYSIQQFYPAKDRQRTHFSSRFYRAKISAEAPVGALEAFFDSATAGNHQVFAEDAAICARIDADTWSCEPPAHVHKGEAKVVQFRHAMKRWITSV